MRFLSIYIYISISVRLHHMCVCICVYIYICSCICTHKPGPQIRNGMHQMPVLVCGLHFLSVSLSLASFHVFVTQWLLPATYWSFAIHVLVRCVCRLLMLYMCTFVCFVPVWLLYTLHSFCKVCHGSYMYIDSFTNIYACACPHSFCTANTQTR